jgi:hypothetical protein
VVVSVLLLFSREKKDMSEDSYSHSGKEKGPAREIRRR